MQRIIPRNGLALLALRLSIVCCLRCGRRSRRISRKTRRIKEVEKEQSEKRRVEDLDKSVLLFELLVFGAALGS